MRKQNFHYLPSIHTGMSSPSSPSQTKYGPGCQEVASSKPVAEEWVEQIAGGLPDGGGWGGGGVATVPC